MPDSRLARAARYNDALAEEHGLSAVADHVGVELDELLHVSQQRALRLVLTETDGRHPSNHSRRRN